MLRVAERTDVSMTRLASTTAFTMATTAEITTADAATVAAIVWYSVPVSVDQLTRSRMKKRSRKGWNQVFCS
jgi:hypothetical protein